ncbi:PilZ domain-containing protein [Ponticoccus sp. (in: a-proteobacteria)]|uniref:PilZ domain-containing protein n=1 Tax=Ponticoccus sp. (in: a-proteobacteria) TaxID=1925025 RepID=UPI003AB187F5
MFGSAYVRAFVRCPAPLRAQASQEGFDCPCRVRDISARGARLSVAPRPSAGPASGFAAIGYAQTPASSGGRSARRRGCS